MLDAAFGRMCEDISFVGNDPGAVRHGNFINYYSFHPPEYRISSVLNEVWKGDSLLVLDIGCNSGDLTQKLYENFLECEEKSCAFNENSNMEKKCVIFGVDLDPTLVVRAQESNKYSKNIFYECLDITTEKSNERIQEILKLNKKIKFDAIFAFSVSMWIHLNHGDAGLINFINKICHFANNVVIEPQPWKCYMTAVKRLKKAGSSFPPLERLKLGQNIECDIEELFTKNKFLKIIESNPSKWSRKVFLYRESS